MSVQLTPSKRHLEQSPGEINGGKKWHKTSADVDSSQSRKPSERNIIRLLYPASKIDDAIGENGNVISEICQRTGAKVHVEETIPGCDERVILITVPDKDSEAGAGKVIADAKETEVPESGKDLDKKGETDQEKQTVIPVADSQSEKENETSPVQKALLSVFDKLIDGFLELKDGEEESNKPSSYVVRLLIFSSQVGYLLGKAGSAIKKMSSESGAEIRVLPKDKLPFCASSADELLQITGGVDGIKKALQSISDQLLVNHLPAQDSSSAKIVGESSHFIAPPPKHGRLPSSNRHFRAANSSRFPDGETNIRGRMNFRPDFLSFRILCSEEKVGGVIGKGGAIIKALQHETGCDLKVLDRIVGSEDRIIIISGPVHPDDGISAPQDALLRVQDRIFRAAPASKEKALIAKVLVSSNQIGCLLGKGGSVIAEMRKATGAYIRIIGKDENPICVSENEEVVQISGEFEIVQEALIHITARLKDHFFREAFPQMGHPPHPPFPDQMPPFPPFMGRREFSPPRMFSNRGPPPFNKFDGPGPLPFDGRFPPHDDHPPFPHDFHGPGIPPHPSERWGTQGPMDGGGPMGFPDFPGPPPQRRPSVFPGGNSPAVITSTTVEVVVPSFVVPAIYGEEGGCLRQICEISDAKITINDPKPGAADTRIVIYGTPEQTNAAQSLIQAFVISETEAT